MGLSRGKVSGEKVTLAWSDYLTGLFLSGSFIPLPSGQAYLRTDSKDLYLLQLFLVRNLYDVLDVTPDLQVVTLNSWFQGFSVSLLVSGVAGLQLSWLQRFLETTGDVPEVSLACLAENKVGRSRGLNNGLAKWACPHHLEDKGWSDHSGSVVLPQRQSVIQIKSYLDFALPGLLLSLASDLVGSSQ